MPGLEEHFSQTYRFLRARVTSCHVLVNHKWLWHQPLPEEKEKIALIHKKPFREDTLLQRRYIPSEKIHIFFEAEYILGKHSLFL